MSNINTNEFATQLGTDPRTARKFLRSITPKDAQPGKGSRWVLDGNKRSLTTMRKNFNTWTAEQAKLAAARAEKAAQEAAEVAETEDEVDTDD